MSEIHEISKHLDELRKRILRIALVVGIITVFILTFHLTPIEFGQTLYNVNFAYIKFSNLKNNLRDVVDKKAACVRFKKSKP